MNGRVTRAALLCFLDGNIQIAFETESNKFYHHDQCTRSSVKRFCELVNKIASRIIVSPYGFVAEFNTSRKAKLVKDITIGGETIPAGTEFFILVIGNNCSICTGLPIPITIYNDEYVLVEK